MALDDLYQEILLDHYKNPRNQGKMSDPDKRLQAKNPFCGDEVTLNLKFDGDRVREISFEGQGCVISQASVSLLTHYVKGKTVDQILELIERFQALVKGEIDQLDPQVEELMALQGVSEFPTRIKCATLAWNTLKKALHEYDSEQSDDEGR
ncbi:SUF system NifU family Fe-S cluster assembly protein [candidate division KSB1 bacterium]|nr:SUF system NifU family Fe-S cluster assembly protein [candidate division KSB1 bacterium]